MNYYYYMNRVAAVFVLHRSGNKLIIIFKRIICRSNKKMRWIEKIIKQKTWPRSTKFGAAADQYLREANCACFAIYRN
jgi:hypothetical protein